MTPAWLEDAIEARHARNAANSMQENTAGGKTGEFEEESEQQRRRRRERRQPLQMNKDPYTSPIETNGDGVYSVRPSSASHRSPSPPLDPALLSSLHLRATQIVDQLNDPTNMHHDKHNDEHDDEDHQHHADDHADDVGDEIDRYDLANNADSYSRRHDRHTRRHGPSTRPASATVARSIESHRSQLPHDTRMPSTNATQVRPASARPASAYRFTNEDQVYTIYRPGSRQQQPHPHPHSPHTMTTDTGSNHTVSSPSYTRHSPRQRSSRSIDREEEVYDRHHHRRDDSGRPDEKSPTPSSASNSRSRSTSRTRSKRTKSKSKSRKKKKSSKVRGGDERRERDDRSHSHRRQRRRSSASRSRSRSKHYTRSISHSRSRSHSPSRSTSHLRPTSASHPVVNNDRRIDTITTSTTATPNNNNTNTKASSSISQRSPFEIFLENQAHERKAQTIASTRIKIIDQHEERKRQHAEQQQHATPSTSSHVDNAGRYHDAARSSERFRVGHHSIQPLSPDGAYERMQEEKYAEPNEYGYEHVDPYYSHDHPINDEQHSYLYGGRQHPPPTSSSSSYLSNQHHYRHHHHHDHHLDDVANSFHTNDQQQRTSYEMETQESHAILPADITTTVVPPPPSTSVIIPAPSYASPSSNLASVSFLHGSDSDMFIVGGGNHDLNPKSNHVVTTDSSEQRESHTNIHHHSLEHEDASDSPPQTTSNLINGSHLRPSKAQTVKELQMSIMAQQIQLQQLIREEEEELQAAAAAAATGASKAATHSTPVNQHHCVDEKPNTVDPTSTSSSVPPPPSASDSSFLSPRPSTGGPRHLRTDSNMSTLSVASPSTPTPSPSSAGRNNAPLDDGRKTIAAVLGGNGNERNRDGGSRSDIDNDADNTIRTIQVIPPPLPSPPPPPPEPILPASIHDPNSLDYDFDLPDPSSSWPTSPIQPSRRASMPPTAAKMKVESELIPVGEGEMLMATTTQVTAQTTNTSSQEQPSSSTAASLAADEPSTSNVDRTVVDRDDVVDAAVESRSVRRRSKHRERGVVDKEQHRSKTTSNHQTMSTTHQPHQPSHPTQLPPHIYTAYAAQWAQWLAMQGIAPPPPGPTALPLQQPTIAVDHKQPMPAPQAHSQPAIVSHTAPYASLVPQSRPEYEAYATYMSAYVAHLSKYAATNPLQSSLAHRHDEIRSSGGTLPQVVGATTTTSSTWMHPMQHQTTHYSQPYTHPQPPPPPHQHTHTTRAPQTQAQQPHKSASHKLAHERDLAFRRTVDALTATLAGEFDLTHPRHPVPPNRPSSVAVPSVESHPAHRRRRRAVGRYSGSTSSGMVRASVVPKRGVSLERVGFLAPTDSSTSKERTRSSKERQTTRQQPQQRQQQVQSTYNHAAYQPPRSSSPQYTAQERQAMAFERATASLSPHRHPSSRPISDVPQLVQPHPPPAAPHPPESVPSLAGVGRASRVSSSSSRARHLHRQHSFASRASLHTSEEEEWSLSEAETEHDR